MTIGFFINTCEPYYRGGYERRVWSFAQELVRLGHQVKIYTSCPERALHNGVEFIPIAPARAYFNAQGVRNGWADLLFLWGLVGLLWKWRRCEVDVLDICATPFLHLPWCRLLCWWKKIPAVVTCHEALLSSIPNYATERGWKPGSWGASLMIGLLSWIYRFGTGAIANRIAVSRQTGKALQEEDFTCDHIVELGLESEAFRQEEPQAAQEAPVGFIFCGRLTPIKQVNYSIQALARLRSRQPLFIFHIIGIGSCRTELEEQVHALDLKSHVIFHGEVSEERKKVLLAQSEIFLLSSPREGFSVATLEAMAQGCVPVIRNHVLHPNGALDFIQHGKEGLVCDAEEEAFAQALVRLMENPEERLRLRKAAWHRAHDYRIEKQARLLVEAYSDVLKSL